jgi:hypothetical protein
MEPAPAPAFEKLPPEEQASALLFHREWGFVSAARLAAAMDPPLALELVETALCRGLATMLSRGYPAEHLCRRFTLTPEQLARAAAAPALGPAFRPLCDWRWPELQTA